MFPLYTLLYFHCLLLIGEASAEITPAEKCIPYLIRAKSFCFPEKKLPLNKKGDERHYFKDRLWYFKMV